MISYSVVFSPRHCASGVKIHPSLPVHVHHGEVLPQSYFSVTQISYSARPLLAIVSPYASSCTLTNTADAGHCTDFPMCLPVRSGALPPQTQNLRNGNLSLIPSQKDAQTMIFDLVIESGLYFQSFPFFSKVYSATISNGTK